MLPDNLRAHLPHAGSMCLLDELVSWDNRSIRCHAFHPADPNNPLRRNGRLAAVHMIEYAGQAAALHGGLLAQRQGVELTPSGLAAIRNLELHVKTLDAVPPPLVIEVHCIFDTGASSIYAFCIKGGGQNLSTGRLIVMPLTETGQ